MYFVTGALPLIRIIVRVPGGTSTVTKSISCTAQNVEWSSAALFGAFKGSRLQGQVSPYTFISLLLQLHRMQQRSEGTFGGWRCTQWCFRVRRGPLGPRFTEVCCHLYPAVSVAC